MHSYRAVVQVFAGVIALALFASIVVVAWRICNMIPDVIALTGGAAATAEREAVLTGVYVPLLQTLVVTFFGTALIKGTVTISDNHFRAINGKAMEPFRLFS